MSDDTTRDEWKWLLETLLVFVEAQCIEHQRLSGHDARWATSCDTCWPLNEVYRQVRERIQKEMERSDA